MSVVLEEYKNLTDGSGADTSAVRRRLVDEWELGGKGKKGQLRDSGYCPIPFLVVREWERKGL
jgi:hypothetical protein